MKTTCEVTGATKTRERVKEHFGNERESATEREEEGVREEKSEGEGRSGRAQMKETKCIQPAVSAFTSSFTLQRIN